MDDKTRIRNALHLGEKQYEDMIARGLADGASLENIMASMMDTTVMIEKRKAAKQKEAEEKKAREDAIRQEENAILEQHRELIERRVTKIAPVCPRCESACVTTYGYFGGSRTRYDFLSCGNNKCRGYHLPGNDYHCDAEPGLEEKDCKRKMFYDPNK